MTTIYLENLRCLCSSTLLALIDLLGRYHAHCPGLIARNKVEIQISSELVPALLNDMEKLAVFDVTTEAATAA